jgi:catechol 2,3-dioxygenase-like lactoylglutathione lyase family enzyme
MAQGSRIGSAVMFVQDLDRSLRFYQEVLDLTVTDRSSTAALLVSTQGTQLILRATGGLGTHALGGVGIQYLIWTADGDDDLHRCERALAERSAYRDTRRSEGVTVVEGSDPDDITVMIGYPGPDERPFDRIPTRIYGW